jgi:hypothetical protein
MKHIPNLYPYPEKTYPVYAGRNRYLISMPVMACEHYLFQPYFLE